MIHYDTRAMLGWIWIYQLLKPVTSLMAGVGIPITGPGWFHKIKNSKRWVSCLWLTVPSGCVKIAIENGTFIVDVPMDYQRLTMVFVGSWWLYQQFLSTSINQSSRCRRNAWKVWCAIRFSRRWPSVSSDKGLVGTVLGRTWGTWPFFGNVDGKKT